MRLLTWMRVQADRVGAALLVAAGVVSLLIGYQKVSEALLTTEQIPYLMSAGLFGVVLVGVGSVLWLSADLRDEWRALKRIEAELAAARQAGQAVVAAEVVVTDAAARGVDGRKRPADGAGRLASMAEPVR